MLAAGSEAAYLMSQIGVEKACRYIATVQSFLCHLDPEIDEYDLEDKIVVILRLIIELGEHNIFF